MTLKALWDPICILSLRTNRAKHSVHADRSNYRSLCLPERPQIIMVSAFDKNSHITYDNVQQCEKWEKQGRALHCAVYDSM